MRGSSLKVGLKATQLPSFTVNRVRFLTSRKGWKRPLHQDPALSASNKEIHSAGPPDGTNEACVFFYPHCGDRDPNHLNFWC